MSSTAFPTTSPASAPPSPSRESAPSANGSPHSRPKKSRVRRFAFQIGIGALLAVLGLTYWFGFRGRRAEPYVGPIWTAAKEKLQLAIVERGTLESAENSEIVCRVKASGKGSTISTTIKWIIDDGTQVVRGQKLIELDDAGLQDQLKDQIIKVNDARAKYIEAEEKVLIQDSQNFSDIETAKINLVLAELELKKFLGERVAQNVLKLPDRVALVGFINKDLEPQMRQEIGTSKDKSLSEVLQTLDEIGGRIEIARSDREQWLDRASWSSRMVKKGYLSRSQAESDKARLDSAEIALKKVQGELDIYRQFTVEQKVTKLWGDIKECERTIDRTKKQANSKDVTAISDRDSKKAVYLQEESKRQDVEEEIRRCIVFAPHDGMVVYFLPEANRGNSSTQQGIVAQGEPVREGQKLIRIPNLSRMLVNTRIHEAMVSRLKGEITRPTGFSEALQAAFSIGRSPLNLAVNHVAYLVDLRDQFRDKDVDVLDHGQRAFIRIAAYASKTYQGRVKSVATVASATDFFTSDVKVYQTMVSIDGFVEHLKPGMSAEVTIIADEIKEPVLTIPIQSVLGSIAMGAERKAYILDDDGQPQLKDITVGASNDKMVQILKGVDDGARVVLNPRSLLDEKSGLKPGVPGKQRGIDVEEVKTKKGGKKGAGGGPPFGSPPMSPAIEGTKNGPRPEFTSKQ
jgi:HlyD family secretion protein